MNSNSFAGRKDLLLEVRFWARVCKTKSCWLWQGYCKNGRYGTLMVSGAAISAHIFSFMLANNLSRRPALKILHRCDVPRCVRPKHLFKGTMKDNTQDCISKGRFSSAKINRRQVAWARGKKTKEIMKRLGLSISHSQALSRGDYWK